MCIALAARITWKGERGQATVPARVGTTTGEGDVDLVMVPEAQVGDFVITHSGYAIRVLADSEVAETARILEGEAR